MNNKIIGDSFMADEMKIYNQISLKGNLSNYSLFIIKETGADFVLSTANVSTGDDDSFDKESRILGFKEVDNGVEHSVLPKNDYRISGKWLKLIKYKGAIIRAIRDANEQYLLFASGQFADELGFKRIPKLGSGIKWVPKSEIEELD
jgi:hypothetical protein